MTICARDNLGECCPDGDYGLDSQRAHGFIGMTHAGADGQRTVMTIEGVSASQEWSMPGPQTR
jgi:hypothetical protein